MNVSRVCEWLPNDVGYIYVRDNGDYLTRIFMDDKNAEDLFFNVALGPYEPPNSRYSF